MVWLVEVFVIVEKTVVNGLFRRSNALQAV